MILFHTGFSEIRKPDIHYGRKNADFGQGFYLSPEKEFSCRWARERKDEDSYLNTYEFNEDGLRIKVLKRDEDWVSCIFANRRGKADTFSQYDVIIGPIANDTLYDTMGILTSGFLSDGQALQILELGPEYTQWVIKSEKALSQLRWLSSRVLTKEEIASCRLTVQKEETEFQTQFAEKIQSFE